MINRVVVQYLTNIYCKLWVKEKRSYFSVDVPSFAVSGEDNQRLEGPSQLDLLASSVASTLRIGLGNRAKVVQVSPIAASNALAIGIILEAANVTRIIEAGPPSDQAVASETFRKLWREKSELRRFKDGSITETVVWDIARPEEATLIPSQICLWLVERHFGPDMDVRSITSDLGWLKILQIPDSAREAVSVARSERLGFRPMIEAYEDLYKILKSVDGELPLSILQVTPSSELLRYSSVFVPHPVDVNRHPTAPECVKYIPRAEIVMQFESSPRWPQDLNAIQKVKLALLEKVARILIAQRRGTRANVVLDVGASDIEDQAALEVLLPQGVAFSIRIYHDREHTLLERALEEDPRVFGTSMPQPSRHSVAPALANYTRRFVHFPQHHSSISPLHHRYPSFSSATRLLKRWCAAHMLSLHLRGEAIELLMASIYLEPGTFQSPASAPAGFMRAIRQLASWDWRALPLLVPVFTAARDDVTPTVRVRFPVNERLIAEEAFSVLRARDKEISRGAWVVVTEEDIHGLRWTENLSKVVAGRVTILAKATLAALEQGFSQGDLDVQVCPIVKLFLTSQRLFITPFAHYDFLIHLVPSVLLRYAQAVCPDHAEWEEKFKFRNFQTGNKDLRLNQDPAESFARDIQVSTSGDMR